jgi:LPXTG-site transpeptidase (sortase) family protein
MHVSSESSSKSAFSLSTVVGLALFVGLMGYFIYHDSHSRAQNTSTPPVQEHVQIGLPVRLKIPKINVASTLESVGLTPEGALAAPDTPRAAAWFDESVRPGEIGTAVIDGHFGWKDGIPAVFDDLSKLQIGDTFSVEDDRGVTRTFVVRNIQAYGENENVSDIFTSDDGKAHLNLITCDGLWSAAEKSYSDRLVVFADEE